MSKVKAMKLLTELYALLGVLAIGSIAVCVASAVLSVVARSADLIALSLGFLSLAVGFVSIAYAMIGISVAVQVAFLLIASGATIASLSFGNAVATTLALCGTLASIMGFILMSGTHPIMGRR